MSSNKKSQCRGFRCTLTWQISGCSALIWYNWQKRVELDLSYVQYILGETTKAVAEDRWLPNHPALCGWLCFCCTNKEHLLSSALRVSTSGSFSHNYLPSAGMKQDSDSSSQINPASIWLYFLLENSSVQLFKVFSFMMAVKHINISNTLFNFKTSSIKYLRKFLKLYFFLFYLGRLFLLFDSNSLFGK